MNKYHLYKSAFFNILPFIRVSACAKLKKVFQSFRKGMIIDEYSEHIYSTEPFDLSVAIWKNGIRYYLTPNQYNNADLTGFTVEGLTVLSDTGFFIISPKKAQTNWVYTDYGRNIIQTYCLT